MPTSKMKNSRFAGELLVAAELSRLGLTVTLSNSFGTNTPKFDLLVANDKGKAVTVQVKALKEHNSFLIHPKKIVPNTIYVMVVVGRAGTLPSFHVASGQALLDVEEELFGKWGSSYDKSHGHGFSSRRLPRKWKNAWNSLGLGKVV